MALRLLKSAILCPLLLVVAGCGAIGGGHHPSAHAPHAARTDWREVVTASDRDRLARWRGAWMSGLDKAMAGNAALVVAQGALLKPDIALADPAPPPGDYRCRTFKMGAQSTGLRDYVAYPAFTCRISQDGVLLRFVKIDGAQRPVGTIYADEGLRMVFLGSMMLGDEARPLAYGRDTERDMVGILERVGPARWRIAFPFPRWESLIEVIELVPKGE